MLIASGLSARGIPWSRTAAPPFPSSLDVWNVIKCWRKVSDEAENCI